MSILGDSNERMVKMKKRLLLLVMLLGLFAFTACGESNAGRSATEPATAETTEATEATTEAATEAATEVETEPATEAETEAVTEANETAYHEIVGEWSYLGTPWFRFYADGSAVNLTDGEAFTWEEDGSLNAIIYESWSISGDTLTVTWSSGASFNYARIADTASAAASAVDTGDYHEIVGEWSYLGTPWFRFNADGTAENLTDGERFRWNEDGTLSNAIIYDTWSVRGNTLTITWTSGASFNYSRD